MTINVKIFYGTCHLSQALIPDLLCFSQLLACHWICSWLQRTPPVLVWAGQHRTRLLHTQCVRWEMMVFTTAPPLETTVISLNFLVAPLMKSVWQQLVLQAIVYPVTQMSWKQVSHQRFSQPDLTEKQSEVDICQYGLLNPNRENKQLRTNLFFMFLEPCCPLKLMVDQVTQAMTNVSWSHARGSKTFIISLTSSRGHARCHTQESHCLMGCITCGTNYTVTMETYSQSGQKSNCAYQGFSSSEWFYIPLKRRK